MHREGANMSSRVQSCLYHRTGWAVDFNSAFLNNHRGKTFKNRSFSVKGFRTYNLLIHTLVPVPSLLIAKGILKYWYKVGRKIPVSIENLGPFHPFLNIFPSLDLNPKPPLANFCFVTAISSDQTPIFKIKTRPHSLP